MVTWGTKLLFSLFNYFSIPAPACQPNGNDRAVSDTDDQISGKFLSTFAFGSLSSDYRRANDDQNAEGDKREVDDEDDVEEGEVAQRGHVLAVGAHQVGPRTGGHQFSSCPRASHVEEHEEQHGDSDRHRVGGEEEGEVGDADEEEGGDQRGEDGRLCIPSQQQHESDVRILDVVLVRLVLANL